MTPIELLDLPMESDNEAGAKTVREYLKTLLSTLWEEGESFSGKRPFGNSGWKHDIYLAMVQGGAIKGTIFDGYADGFSTKAADKLVMEAIANL